MELFNLFGIIALKNNEANDGIDETTGKAEKAQSKISAAFEKIGTAAVKVGKTIAVGLGAGATAIGALAKQSLDSYADYEQLVGGVETLFKDSAAKVQDYADAAYETAGLSANAYMETVTSFSASLLQSLGGDTDKAAEVANRAIIDMSDNANKMGTSMESIQNAYQGFAKQNYTMLDNLKLGYGGTKEEMARLISDASTMTDAMEKLGVSVDANSMSFGNIVNAISVVQESMGITGTTANEAATTISGSIASMKAQWSNLKTAFAGDGFDIGVYVENFVEAAKTAIDNVVPRIAQILSGISEAMTMLMPIISAELPDILQALLPGVIDGAVALINGLIASLPAILQILIEQLPSIFLQLSNGLVQTFPVLLETVKNLFGQIWDYIAVELLGTEADFESSFVKIQEIFMGLWEALQYVWETIGQPIWGLIQECVGIVSGVFAEKMPEIQAFVQRCFADIKNYWDNHLKPCLEAIGNFIENVLAPVFEFVFQKTIVPLIQTAFSFVENAWENALKPVLTGITDFLTGVFSSNFTKAFEGIVSIVKGIANDVINIIETMVNGAISALNGLIAGLNKVVSLAGSLLGLNISIPTIPLLNLPRLEEGGILDKGQVGLLEGNGAEAVVPLDQNRAWISAVARDMEAAGIGGNSQQAQQIIELLEMLIDMLPETMKDAFASMKFDVNNREFARLVKAVG